MNIQMNSLRALERDKVETDVKAQIEPKPIPMHFCEECSNYYDQKNIHLQKGSERHRDKWGNYCILRFRM